MHSCFESDQHGTSVDFLAGPDGLCGPVTTTAKLGKLIMVKNKTGMTQDISVGTFVSNSSGVLTYDPTFLWMGVR